MNFALGLIETKGLIGAIEAADAMAKAAKVKIISKELVSGALVIIKVTGETAAVKAAVDAGSFAAQRVGQLVSAHVIPRPDDQIDILINDRNGKTTESAKEKNPVLVNETSKKQQVTASSPKETRIDQSKNINTIEKVVEQTDAKIVKNVIVKKTSAGEPKEKIITKTDVPTKSGSSKKIPTLANLEILNVHSLRRIARGIEDFPIKGREISKANRGKLLDYFRKLQ